MITQQQAERAVELLKEVDHYVNGNLAIPIRLSWIEQRIQLLAEIKANEPTATATQAQNWTAIKVKTNGDIIRNMSDEELAEEFMGYILEDCCFKPTEWLNERYDQILDWLKEEVK